MASDAAEEEEPAGARAGGATSAFFLEPQPNQPHPEDEVSPAAADGAATEVLFVGDGSGSAMGDAVGEDLGEDFGIGWAIGTTALTGWISSKSVGGARLLTSFDARVTTCVLTAAPPPSETVGRSRGAFSGSFASIGGVSPAGDCSTIDEFVLLASVASAAGLSVAVVGASAASSFIAPATNADDAEPAPEVDSDRAMTGS